MKIYKKLQKFFEISVGKRLKISIWLIPVLIFSVHGKYADIFLISYLSAILHELAHILCAKKLSVKISNMTLYPFGVCGKLHPAYIKSSEKEFFIAFSGPFISLILFGIFAFLSHIYARPVLTFAADANLALCAINLVPALPLDGGRMLKSLLTTKYGILRAYNFSIRLSRILIVCLFVLGVALIIFFRFNFSLILISAFLMQNLCNEQHTISHIAFKEILSVRDKVNSTTMLPVKFLCAGENQPASAFLKHLGYDNFHVLYVLDSNCRIKKVLTETQIIDALLGNSIRLKYSDI